MNDLEVGDLVHVQIGTGDAFYRTKTETCSGYSYQGIVTGFYRGRPEVDNLYFSQVGCEMNDQSVISLVRRANHGKL